ncbi:MAG: dienelactone hydrolase family protein [Anaerolineales bacterium]|nr:dienelactone hydrolase family protein [Anaerolineales bacterium]
MRQITAGKQIGQTHQNAGRQLHYLLFLPRKYGVEDQQSWPLLMFLHGIGERGDSKRTLSRLKRYGPARMVEEDPEFPCVVVAPQCPSETYWAVQLDLLDTLFDELQSTLHVDPDRIYLTGLSMGGYGCWHYALNYPDRCAAVVPIAGGFKHQSREIPDNICVLKDMPVWAFHGSADTVVLPYQTESLVEALKACGSFVRYSRLEGADHAQSWERAYADPQLWAWMMAQRRV